MHRWTRWTLAVAGVVALTAVSSARALVIAPPVPGPARVAQADAVVVGRIVAHEDKDVEVAFPGGGKQTYRIAVVNVTELVRGPKDAKMVRVGFIAPPKGAVGPDGAPVPVPIRIRPGFGPMNLEVGQDGMFFLSKHPKENFYTVGMFNDFVPRMNPNFEQQLNDAKTTVKLLENPIASLKTGNAEERLKTAALLISKYRQVRAPSGKTEPISAEESKLILQALLDGNWEPRPIRPGLPGSENSLNLFFQLGVPPTEFQAKPGEPIQESAKAWIKKNLDSYRIQRIIPGEGPIGVGPGVPPPVILPVDPGIRPVPLPIKKLKIKIDRNDQ